MQKVTETQSDEQMIAQRFADKFGRGFVKLMFQEWEAGHIGMRQAGTTRKTCRLTRIFLSTQVEESFAASFNRASLTGTAILVEYVRAPGADNMDVEVTHEYPEVPMQTFMGLHVRFKEGTAAVPFTPRAV